MTSKPSAKKTGASQSPEVTLSPYLMRRHRAQLGDWFKGNGIDPNLVSADHEIHGEGTTVTYWAFDLDTDGRKQVNAGTGEAAVVKRTTRCSVPLPDLRPNDEIN